MDNLNSFFKQVNLIQVRRIGISQKEILRSEVYFSPESPTFRRSGERSLAPRLQREAQETYIEIEKSSISASCLPKEQSS